MGQKHLWYSDGTSKGTLPFLNIKDSLKTSNNGFSFIFRDSIMTFKFMTDSFGIQLWVSDGTEIGTKQHLSTRLDESLNNYPLSNNDIFASVNSNLGTELHMKVGDSLQFFRDSFPSNASSFPINFINLNDSLVAFSTTRPNSTSNIWIINKNSKSRWQDNMGKGGEGVVTDYCSQISGIADYQLNYTNMTDHYFHILILNPLPRAI